MSRAQRRTVPAAVLAVALLLVPAVPVLAAPADAVVGGVFGWLDAWLAWPSDAVARITGADETLPSMDPNGVDASPLPADGAGESQTAPENQGETLPSMDPDG
jgi:hypothetical protein